MLLFQYRLEYHGIQEIVVVLPLLKITLRHSRQRGREAWSAVYSDNNRVFKPRDGHNVVYLGKAF